MDRRQLKQWKRENFFGKAIPTFGKKGLKNAVFIKSENYKIIYSHYYFLLKAALCWFYNTHNIKQIYILYTLTMILNVKILYYMVKDDFYLDPPEP